MDENYKIKSRIWIEAGDKVFLGEGRVQLLKAIENEGSLSKAAKSMKMSYKKAWTLVDAVNKSAKEDVVVRSAGGKQGGGTELTLYGKRIVEAFEKINQKCWYYLDKQFKAFEDL